VSVGILLWIVRLRMTWDLHGLAPIFFFLFVVYDHGGAVCTVLVLACAVFVPYRFSFRPILRWMGERPGVVALGSAILMSVGALLIYRNHPLSQDEYAPVFQSQAFAMGRLSGEFPVPLLDWVVPPKFQNYFLSVSHLTGRAASTYWPSFALLLTPFTWLGIPWACNPAISALTLIAIHRLALHLFEDREAAGLAVLLTLASPVFFANGISYYSMPAHLLANAVFVLLLMQPTAGRAFAAGVVGSVALTLHNPMPHLLFAAPWLVGIAVQKRWRVVIGIATGYLPLCLLLGAGWLWFSNNLMHEGLGAATSAPGTAVGKAWLISPFTLPSATVLLARLVGVAKIWVWSVPGMLMLASVGAWKWRQDARCKALAMSAIATLVGYLFVWPDQGHGWGFRYFHSAWLTLPVLAVAALARIPVAQQQRNVGGDEDTRTFLVACALITLVVGNALRGVQIGEVMADHLNQLPKYSGSEPRVVFIDVDNSRYALDLVQNDPLLQGRIIRMISHGAAANAAVMRDYFPSYRRAHADANGEVWSAMPTPGGERQPSDSVGHQPASGPQSNPDVTTSK
jgi:hypothetical protein